MRKILFFVGFSLMSSFIFIACNDMHDDYVISQDINDGVSDYYQPYDMALTIALRQLDACSPRTRSHVSRTVKEHYVYSPSISTRATDVSTVRFHVINFDNEQGFAIVSADKRTTPVYAYSPTGNIDLKFAVENTGFGVFMKHAELYYQEEISRGGDKPLPPWTDPSDSSFIDLIIQVPVIVDGIECYQRQVSTYEDKGPLLETAWHQFWPYNYFCPIYVDSVGNPRKCPAGCGPIAMGQIMAYHQHPTGYGGYNFNWNRICSGSNVSPNDTCKARLVSLIGSLANASYNGNGTSTIMSNIRAAFQQMGYSLSQEENYVTNSRDSIIANISANHPMYFEGYRSGDSIGHAWVVDGYQQITLHTTYYHTYYPYPEYKTVTTETLYYYCNFGFGTGSSYCLNVYDNIYVDDIHYLQHITPNR